MKAFRYIDAGVLYVVIIGHSEEDERLSSLSVLSCWRFYPGRTSGEPISLSRLPWHGRQELAEILNNSMP